MIISRYKYDLALKEAYEKGRVEAEERAYRDRPIERVYEKLYILEEEIRKLKLPTESRDGHTCNETSCGNPFPG